jgi:hypothetical protein
MPPTLKKKKKYTKNLSTLKRQVSLINKMRTNFPTWASRATLQTKKYEIFTPKRKSVLLCYPFPSPTYTHIVTLSQIQTHIFLLPKLNTQPLAPNLDFPGICLLLPIPSLFFHSARYAKSNSNPFAKVPHKFQFFKLPSKL